MQVHKDTLLEKPTLKFARSVSTIELGDARANIESSYIMQLKEKVLNLKKTLASKEAQNRQFNQIQDHHLRFQNLYLSERLHKYGPFQDAEAVTEPFGNSFNGISTMEVYRLNPSRCPTSLYQKRIVKQIVGRKSQLFSYQ
ncbi:KINESIN-LIKE PROTEIN KIN-14L [Salix purpurea]|uniref:KINESIN-LIKE PROTEIN KIN-14L n=1 Tax=Salix purpurea TaxID=77065 RepID=A0A9Q0VWH6_SALPP|nr:KINESIN-LIKE PROTEIN KIN-14L [Salix purpurea]